MNLFKLQDYRDVIRDKIRENKSIRGYQTLLAEASGCQRSYLSQVLNSHVHLTSDHGAKMARFWGFGEDETDFFLELISYARAGSEARKEISLRRLSAIQKKRESVAQRLKSSAAPSEQMQAIYYSSWHWMAIHAFLSVPAFSTESEIAKKLGLTLSETHSYLSQMETFKLCEKHGDHWKVIQNDVHLPKDSHFTATNHLNWRLKAIQEIQKKRNPLTHYSGVYALSKADVKRLNDLLLDMIEKGRSIVVSSKEEEVVCLNCDLFRI